MTEGLLDKLNDPQRAAVTAGEGPMLVLAGPGSGKTRVLTHRVAYLIDQMNVRPYHIMAVTFTNKAAAEMRLRIEHLLGERPAGLQIGTFHSTCARILRIEADSIPYNQDYVIYDTDDQITAMTQAVNEEGFDPKRFSPRRILYAMSHAKNEMILPDDYPIHEYFDEVVARVYRRYQSILLDSNAMDFDDLLLQMALLMRNNEIVREKYQNRYDWVLVDEFQDTNMVQYELVKHLGRPRNNIFVVGDEDQSIYAFRGADYRNVMQFRTDYPDAQVVLLEQNYRSSQIILDAARAIIDKNNNRTPKALFTDRVDGEPVFMYEAYNEDYEAEYVLEQIAYLRQEEGYNFSDFAVMYRTNAQSRALESACIKVGIPYVLVGGVGFYKRREVKDLLAYLRVVNNPSDRVSFARIANTPKRGIGKKSLQDFQFWAARDDLDYREALDKLIEGEDTPLSARTARLFAAFGEQLTRWRTIADGGDLLHLFDTIAAETGFISYLNDISDNDAQFTERTENVDELRGLIKRAQEDEIPLAEFLTEQSLVSDVDSLEAGADSITLLTLHAAKGLEYPVVFLAGLEEGLLPHMRSLEEAEGLDEERRLLYVGITRAKDRLYVTYTFRRALYGGSGAPNAPSRFLGDLPAGLIEGMTPKVYDLNSRSGYQHQTTWDNEGQSGLNRLRADLQKSKQQPQETEKPRKPINERIRSKIVQFPGGQQQTLKTGMRVRHTLFGVGTVIETQGVGHNEEATVAFEDRRYGIKRMNVEIAKMEILSP